MSKNNSKPPLSKTHPKLAKEADGWNPSLVTHGVSKKAKWKCKEGHSWEASINSRSSGVGCPYCAGKIPVIGVNDLQTTHPLIASKAVDWNPQLFSAGSGKKVKWKCKKGHQWTGYIYAEINRDVFCSFCSGRKLTSGENDLEVSHPDISKEAYGWTPSDFKATSPKKVKWKCKLGHVWSAQISNRSTRGDGCPICSNRVVKVGFNDLKTTHPEIAKQAHGWDSTSVTAGNGKKAKWKCKEGHVWEAAILDRSKGNGCPICSNRVVKVGFNDLKTTHPEIAKQAHGWDSTSVTAGNGKKAKWKCKEGHVWDAQIRNRARKQYGCPICSGKKILPGFNDLKTKFPEVASEAFDWDPTQISPGDNRKRTWKCSLGHIWKVSVTARTSKGSGCLVCANIDILPGFNDLYTINPVVAKQAHGWDPRKFGVGSEKVMTWKCELGHIYKSKIYETAKRGFGCRVCSGREVLKGFNDLLTKFPRIAAEADGWDPSEFTIGSTGKKSWKCKQGHKWKTRITARVSGGTGCPSCAKFGFSQTDPGWIYLMEQENWEMLQIGITNFPEQRLSMHKKSGWQLIDLRGPMAGELVREWETSILKMLKNTGADLANENIAGKFDGYSEAWSKSKFQAKSIKELMKLTEEYEEEKSVTNLSHRKTKKD